jgi:hypothetical protein
MLTFFLALAAIVLGLWLGFTTRATGRSVGGLVGGAVFFFVAALGLYGWQCDAATIPDIHLFREVPGQYFCNGRLTLLAYALVLGVPIVSVRALATKSSTPNA